MTQIRSLEEAQKLATYVYDRDSTEEIEDSRSSVRVWLTDVSILEETIKTLRSKYYKINVLTIRDSNATDETLKQIARFISPNTKLDLSFCIGLTNDGLVHIKDFTDLNLSWTLVTDEGTKYLRKKIRLNLSGCDITSISADDLANCQELDLSWTGIDNSCFSSFEFVDRLTMHGCLITESGVRAFLRMRQSVKGIYLDTSYCQKISDSFYRDFETECKYNFVKVGKRCTLTKKYEPNLFSFAKEKPDQTETFTKEGCARFAFHAREHFILCAKLEALKKQW